ncbi:MAG: aldo/keto reductase [Bryobacteraceae bacterium]
MAAGVGLPAVATASRFTPPEPQAKPQAQKPADALSYRVLGKTGLKVTTVGFGCMITSDGSVIERAADMGINYFDTARGYSQGNNERMVGAALKSKRKNLILSTKSHGRTKQDALAELDKSLSELGTDYVDIWYLHALSRGSDITEELVDAQQTAKKAGKIRFAGVSTHGGQPDVIAALVKNPNMDVVLAAYNFTMDQQVKDAVASAAAAGKGVVAMKVMAGGFRRLKPGNKFYNTLKKDGAMVAALKWVINDRNVHTTVPSITDVDQLEDNFKCMQSKFSEQDQQILARHLEFLRPLYCRMCGACDGKCPKGVPVADVLRFLTYAEGYGQFGLGRERFLELPGEVANVRCKDCSECAIQCPNGVRVAQRLIRAQELFA